MKTLQDIEEEFENNSYRADEHEENEVVIRYNRAIEIINESVNQIIDECIGEREDTWAEPLKSIGYNKKRDEIKSFKEKLLK